MQTQKKQWLGWARLRAFVLVLSLSVFWQSPMMAAIQTFTSQGQFTSQLQPVYLFSNFSSAGSGTSLGFSGNGYSFTVTASGGIFGVTGKTMSGDFPELEESSLRTSSPGYQLIVNFSSSPTDVFAIGGNFFFSDAAGEANVLDGTVTATVTLSDSTSQPLSVTTSGGTIGFGGFTSDGAKISSLTLSSSSGIYTTMDNFYVGAPVPEAGGWVAGGLAGLFVMVRIGMAVVRRRRATDDE